MAEKKKVNLGAIKDMAPKGIKKIDTEALRSKVEDATDTLKTKAVEAKDAAVAVKDDITDKLTELDRMLQDSVTEYNDSYTLMNDAGVKLFVERTRALDTVAFVEKIVNSIANKPKSLETDFDEINVNRKKFVESCEFAEQELHEARMAATGAGAGVAAGASVAFMAPTAAMWIATTFGTASTGTAISTLSGAAATNAALAWLGGGALTAGGGGVAAGHALLALAGPIGWTISGAALLSSILIFSTKKAKLNKQKNEEIQVVKENTELIREMHARINAILGETGRIRTGLGDMLDKVLPLYGADYTSLNTEQKHLLGALVNNTKTLSAMFGKNITEEEA